MNNEAIEQEADRALAPIMKSMAAFDWPAAYRARVLESVAENASKLAAQYRAAPPDWARPSSNVNARVWAGAVALAAERHPNAPYPQPNDEKDAMTYLLLKDFYSQKALN